MFDKQAPKAFIVTCIVLIGAGIGFRAAVGYLNVYLQKEPVELREHFTTIARHLDTWRASGADLTLDATVIETLGTDLYLDRTYTRRSESSLEQIAVHLAYYTGIIDAIPHVPDRCLLAGGYQAVSLPHYYDLKVDKSDWHEDSLIHNRSGKPYPIMTAVHPITGRPMMVRMPIGPFRLRVTEFRHPDAGEARIFAGFFFIANGQLTASPYQVRSLAFDKTDRYAYYCKVQFQMIGSGEFDVDGFAETVSEFLAEFLPELMRCLPDWSEVERQD